MVRDKKAEKGGVETTWVGAAGAAALDLRSDTMTTPTLAMLSSIQNCSLLDDVMMEDRSTAELEEHVAKLCGKDAALFVLSGTMGNQIGLRTLLTQPPHSVLCDANSHIFKYEAGGVSSLTGALVKTVQPANGRFLTLEDIESRVDLSGDVHSCPVRVISLENTLNGVVMPLDEVKRISDWARSHGIKLHCDGARLWEAVAADAGTLSQFAACFDSVTLCFSKGLGAPIGSILVGDRSFIDHARWIRKSIGGGLRQAGVVSAPALVAVRETFEAGRLAASHVVARRVEKMWRDKGGQVKLPVDTNMVWLDLDSALTTESRLQQLGEEAGLRLMGNRLVCHYQIGDEALERLENVFNRVFQEKRESERNGRKANDGKPSKKGKYRTGPYDSPN